MRFSWYIILLPLLCISLSWAQNRKEIWVVQSKSAVSVSGTSNVSPFTCKSTSKSKADTIIITRRLGPNELCLERSRVSIDAAGFDCRHRTITNDFKETLKAERFPHIFVTFLNLHCADMRQAHHHRAAGTVEISIAGVTQAYQISFAVSPYDPQFKTLELCGTQAISFSDFNLCAPEKLFGLIQVDEVIHVNFNLVLRQVRVDG